MKSQPAFVRADGTVHLDSKSAVHVDIPLIVLPGDTKHNYALRFDDPLENFRFAIFGVTIEHERKRLDNLLDRLMKLRFPWVLRLHFGQQI